jgi:hypothetical protein
MFDEKCKQEGWPYNVLKGALMTRRRPFARRTTSLATLLAHKPADAKASSFAEFTDRLVASMRHARILDYLEWKSGISLADDVIRHDLPVFASDRWHFHPLHPTFRVHEMALLYAPSVSDKARAAWDTWQEEDRANELEMIKVINRRYGL